MMNGMKSLVGKLALLVKGNLEGRREFRPRNYKINGITVKHQLYPSDENERYFHIYAVTATQKSILKAFDLAETNVRKQATGINEYLKSCNTKEA